MPIVNQYGDPGTLMDVAYAIGQGKGAEERRRFERVQGANERAQFADIQQGRDRLNLGRDELRARVSDQNADRTERSAQAQAQRDFQLEMQGRQQDASNANREDTQAFETAKYEQGSSYDQYQQREQQRRADTELQIRNPTAYDKKKRYELIEGIKRVQSEGQAQGWRPQEIQAKTAALQQELLMLGPEPKEPTVEEQIKGSIYWDGGEWDKGTPWIMDPKTGMPQVPRGWTPPDKAGAAKITDQRKRYDLAMKDAEAEVTADFEAQRDRQIGEIQAQIAQMDSGDVTPPSVQRKIGKLNADIRRLESLRPDRVQIEQRAEQILAEDQEFYDKMDQQNNGQVTQRPGMTPPFVAAPKSQAEYDQVQPGNPYLSADAYGLPLIKGKEGEGYQLQPGKTAVPAAGAGAWEQEMERVRQSFPNNPAVKQAADVMELLMTTRGNVQNMSPEEQKAYMRAKQVLQKTGL